MIPSVDHCKTEFERVSRRRRLAEPVQFGHLRWEALDRFLSLGFPTTRDEGWALTNVAPIANQIFTVASEPPSGDRVDCPTWGLPVFGSEVVFVNGYYMPDASTAGALPDGARVEPLSAVLHSNPDDIDPYVARVAPFERLPFVALNTALFMDGACIRIPAGAVVTQPIHVRFVSTGEADVRPAMSHPRVLIVLDDASEATIVESYAGPDGVEYFTNAVTEIVLGQNARLDCYALQHESTRAYHINATYAVAAGRADCSVCSVSLGGALVRNDITTLLAGDGAQCNVNTVYLGDGQRLVHNHITVEHAAARSRSQQVSSGILADQAIGVYESHVIARADARETSARQTNRALLLSADARVHAAPHLEILATGVDYGHRAIVRHLDDEAAVCSRAQGVGHRQARREVIRAFVDQALRRVRVAPLRGGLMTAVHAQLERVLANA